MEELEKVFGEICTAEEITEIIREVDTNHDGKISFEEFKNMMSYIKVSDTGMRQAWSLP